MSKQNITIGLEIHAQINTKSKLFSTARSCGVGVPNENVDNFDIAVVGTLPKLNAKAVELAAQTGLALNMQVNKNSKFDRKRYYYLDLPLGYQITQFYEPICTNGYLVINGKTIGINRIHMECDAGKTIHDPSGSLLDYNRVGIPLMEIVTEPHLKNPEDAGAFVEELILHLLHVGSCDCNLELGNLRIDVNVSVDNPDGSLGTRVEIKNINSIKFMKEAILYETKRQAEVLESGNKVVQETRGFQQGATFSLRSKEDAFDYRYAPDYNIPSVKLDDQYIQNLINTMPELPAAKRMRYAHLNNPNIITTLLNNMEMSHYVDSLRAKDPIMFCNLLMNALCGIAHKHNKSFMDLPAETLEIISNMVVDEYISMKTAKEIIEKSLLENINPKPYVEQNNLTLINDINELTTVINTCIKNNETQWLKYKAGDEKLLMFLVGTVLKATSQRGNHRIIEDILRKL